MDQYTTTLNGKEITFNDPSMFHTTSLQRESPTTIMKMIKSINTNLLKFHKVPTKMLYKLAYGYELLGCLDVTFNPFTVPLLVLPEPLPCHPESVEGLLRKRKRNEIQGSESQNQRPLKVIKQEESPLPQFKRVMVPSHARGVGRIVTQQDRDQFELRLYLVKDPTSIFNWFSNPNAPKLIVTKESDLPLWDVSECKYILDVCTALLSKDDHPCALRVEEVYKRAYVSKIKKLVESTMWLKNEDNIFPCEPIVPTVNIGTLRTKEILSPTTVVITDEEDSESESGDGLYTKPRKSKFM